MRRGWAGYFHYRISTEVMTHMTHYARDRFRRWLWREHDPTRGLLIAKLVRGAARAAEDGQTRALASAMEWTDSPSKLADVGPSST